MQTGYTEAEELGNARDYLRMYCSREHIYPYSVVYRRWFDLDRS